MAVSKINTTDPNSFYQQISAPQKNIQQHTASQFIPNRDKPHYPPSVFDKLIEKVVNKRDLNDVVIVPRSIFKGYFAFMTATSIAALNSLIKGTKASSKALKNVMTAASAIIGALGTYSFVKPYLVKQKDQPKNS